MIALDGADLLAVSAILAPRATWAAVLCADELVIESARAAYTSSGSDTLPAHVCAELERRRRAICFQEFSPTWCGTAGMQPDGTLRGCWTPPRPADVLGEVRI